MHDYVFFFIGFVVGVFMYFMFNKYTVKPSYFTSMPFEPEMTPADATKSYTDQTKAISDEMKAELLTAAQDKKNHLEMIAISDKYSDQLCDLNKSFSHYQINRIPV
jgi:hypothetical protein